MVEKKKLLCIAGESGRGKDTVGKMLKKRGYKDVCSFTTRPMRETETQNVEHHFVSEAEANRVLKEHSQEVLAYTEIGDVKYFALTHDIVDADFYIIDPKGIEYLKSAYGYAFDLFVCYVTCDRDLAWSRINHNERGDSKEEFDNRCEKEGMQFNNFSKLKQYDHVIVNSGSLKELEEKVEEMLMRFNKIGVGSGA